MIAESDANLEVIRSVASEVVKEVLGQRALAGGPQSLSSLASRPILFFKPSQVLDSLSSLVTQNLHHVLNNSNKKKKSKGEQLK